jgi:hypothetical protein
MTTNIEEEWRQFILTNGNNGLLYSSISSHTNKNDGPFKVEKKNESIGSPLLLCHEEIEDPSTFEPICEDLSISTKTKVLYLNNPIDIHPIFWEIPVIEYCNPTVGVVKKQIKIVSNTVDEYEEYKKKLDGIPYYVEHLIKQINNVGSRTIKFKDERKITIGLSKKDIMTTHNKTKNAFYNCFAVIFRILFEGIFREIHVKVFNTGKLEIPGVLNPKLLEIVKQNVLDILSPHFTTSLEYVEMEKESIILINSNFNCGYYINRDKLYALLRSPKYSIETAFDPCTYPGVKCKFYFNVEMGFDVEKQRGLIQQEDRDMKMSELEDNNKYVEISFMIFRTGSCIIVGNCTEEILNFVYEFIKKIFKDEYNNIQVMNDKIGYKTNKNKTKKRIIEMTNDYFTTKFPNISLL